MPGGNGRTGRRSMQRSDGSSVSSSTPRRKRSRREPMSDTMERRLRPSLDLAAANTAQFPNESEAYRKARNALLAEEIELRRHAERVAERRRALPPGGEVTRAYAFVGEDGPVTLEGLFADKETLVVYSYMFGPERAAPCPMCTSFMSGFE